MSQQYPNGPQQPFHPQQPMQPVRPPKMPMKREAKIGWMILSGVVIFVLGLVIGAAGSGNQLSPSTSAGKASPTVTVTVPVAVEASEPAAAETTTEPPAPVFGTPTKADFKLAVKTLTKKCFGSAGCNVTYRILVSYSGPALDPATTYEVLYQVKGGEDGPVDNKLTVTGDQSSVDEEEMIQTKSSKTKLTVVVTDVLGQ